MSRIYIARPRYGPADREHESSVFVSGSKHQCYIGDALGSATPNQFNQEWCQCLNNADPPYDYFLMLHADVAPLRTEKSWIDTLVEECEGYDVMHAFCRIKDDSGNTSTIVCEGTEPFDQTSRHVTMRQLDKLPDTFDTQKYCRGLRLPQTYAVMGCNTGCMLIDLKNRGNQLKFRRFPGFSWLTLVMVTKLDDPKTWVLLDHPEADPCGELRPFFWPEDWAFGQWCAKNSLRVGGTRKVITNHYGSAFFSTHPSYTCGKE